jgi:putative nucleotidyltransferase with HDIG domain
MKRYFFCTFVPINLDTSQMKLYSDAALAKILDQDIFHQISRVADRLGVECYVVGGYVRDIFLERPSDDIDVVVVGSGIEVAKALKQQLGRRAHLSVFKNFGTAQVKMGDMEVEFVGARRESYSHDSRKPIVEDGTLEDDQNRRDFTINAMAICLNSSRFGQLVDPFNGIADLEDGIIATPLDPEVTFSDDPLRMMRCIRFATQLNFQIEDETFEGLQRMADRIRIVSGERIAVELNKIMLAPHPSIGFEYLQRSGLLQIILPEVAALDIVERRDGRAHKNNFYHSLEVLENVCKNVECGMWNVELSPTAMKNDECGINSSLENSSSQRSENHSTLNIPHSTLWLRWAALLHDVGKTKSKRWEPGVGWTFHNHNIIGAKMVPQIFRRLKLPMGAEMRQVQLLVDLHMRPQVIADSEVTDSAVRRLLNDAGDYIDDLMLLCEADITSKNEVKKRMFLENFRMVREKLADLKEKDYKRLLQPVIDGNEIMQMFHLQPSREVGVLKQYLKDAVLDNRVDNEREALMALLIDKARQMGLPIPEHP